jgi:hypothetical protein
VEAIMADKNYVEGIGFVLKAAFGSWGEAGQPKVFVKKTDVCSEAERKRICEAQITVRQLRQGRCTVVLSCPPVSSPTGESQARIASENFR